MICRKSPRGFSLLEVMIATAILAASAMVLLSLISLGTRFGSKAEVRIGALVQAQSILDESILRMQSGESIENYTGVLPGSKPRSYRVTIEPFLMSDPTGLGSMSQDPNATANGMGLPAGGSDSMSPNGQGAIAPVGPKPSELVSMKIELYDSDVANVSIPGGGASGGSKPLVELTRLVRRAPSVSDNGTSGMPASGLPRR